MKLFIIQQLDLLNFTHSVLIPKPLNLMESELLFALKPNKNVSQAAGRPVSN